MVENNIENKIGIIQGGVSATVKTILILLAVIDLHAVNLDEINTVRYLLIQVFDALLVRFGRVVLKQSVFVHEVPGARYAVELAHS